MKDYYGFILLTFLFVVGCKHTHKVAAPPSPPTPPSIAPPPPPPPPPAPPSEKEVVMTLYTTHKNHKISKCKKGGAAFYTTEMNAPDASTDVFDALGAKVASCSPLNSKTSFCKDLTECQILFVNPKNIWGIKPVDVLGLNPE